MSNSFAIWHVTDPLQDTRRLMHLFDTEGAAIECLRGELDARQQPGGLWTAWRWVDIGGEELQRYYMAMGPVTGDQQASEH